MPAQRSAADPDAVPVGARPAGRVVEEAAFAGVAPAALELLRSRFGAGVWVTGYDFVHHEGHPIVAVVHLAGAAVSSAVVKMAARAHGHPVDRSRTGSDTPFGQLIAEWGVLEFFGRRGGDRLPVPEFYGGNLDAGIIVMADLGAGDSLAEVLLRAGGAAAAERALGAYVDAFVALHVASFGRSAEFEQIRARMGTPTDSFDRSLARTGWPAAAESSERLGVGVSVVTTAQVQGLCRHVLESIPWRAVSLRDVCPDNNRVLRDGRVVLFDGQFAGVQHALLDVAYLHSTMPTCWCVRRLPTGLADSMAQRYLAGLRCAGLEVTDAEFERELALCRAYMAMWRLTGTLARVDAHDDDGDLSHWDHYDFDLASMRQEVLLRSEQVGEALGLVSGFEHLQAWAVDLAAAARAAWPSTRPLPLYPAWI